MCRVRRRLHVPPNLLGAVAPAASILFPTRDRRAYLAVALASVAGQAAAHGAEIVVVEDGPRDPETERLAESRTGARYVALGAPRGLNVARNAAVEAAAADLLCFLDDDVAAWPGWLAALLAAAAREPGARGVRRPDPRAARGHEPARLRPRAGAGDHARPRARRSRRRARVGREPHAAPRRARPGRRVRPRAGPGPATRRSGSGGCARPAGGSATSPPPASTTAAPAPTRASAGSRAPRGTAAATRAGSTRRRAPHPAWRASCARSPAASGTPAATAAATGSSSTAQTAGRLRAGART